jgi:glyoxylase-like metal-dependent hydrolase (beta-lactamase superfamily II)
VTNPGEIGDELGELHGRAEHGCLVALKGCGMGQHADRRNDADPSAQVQHGLLVPALGHKRPRTATRHGAPAKLASIVAPTGDQVFRSVAKAPAISLCRRSRSPIAWSASMPSPLPEYELYAIRYATREARRRDNFIGGDPHDGPMPMDYYTWVALGHSGAYVIDTGFTAAMASARQRSFLRCPVDSLALLGLEAGAVRDVILTHMHYDHVGNFHKFPNARFHLQEREMAYATGKYMRYPRIGHSYHVEDVVGMVRLNFKGRVEMHNGEVELAPGLTLHPTHGHSDGLQSVRIHTKRGWVVLASDATHYYENMATNRPFTTAFHIGQMLDAYRTLERLAPTPRHIVPGHDPYVMQEYPAAQPALETIVVRLDAEPIAPPLSFGAPAGH